MNDDLFGDDKLCDDRTDLLIRRLFDLPINYVGNKKKLVLQILEMLGQENVEFNTAFDAFSGSCVVSLVFNRMGKNVIANDLLSMSSLAAVFYLECRRFPLSAKDVDELLQGDAPPCSPAIMSQFKWRHFLPAEAGLLDQIKRNILRMQASKGTGIYTGMRIGSDGRVEPSIMYEKGYADQETPHDLVGSFAMHAVCTHILQKCFLGGRYYNGQTLCRLRARVKRGRTGKNKLEGGNDMRTLMHKLRNAFLPESHPAAPVFESFRDTPSPGTCSVFNCDVIRLLDSGTVNADLAYFDPPYGGDSSNYSTLYGICEEYIRGHDPMADDEFANASKRFSNKAEYEKNFSIMLDLSRRFPTWLLSFNESSYASIDSITSQIKKFRQDVVVKPIRNYGYNYRKKTNTTGRESEFLILARA